MTLPLIVLGAILGCDAEFIQLTAVVNDGPGVDAPAAPGVEVTSLGYDLGVIETVTADDAGQFEVLLPKGAYFYLELDGADWARTTWWGIAGQVDSTLPEDTLFVLSQADADALRARYAGCPGADGVGAFVYGEVRFYAPGYEPDPGQEWPLAITAAATLVGDGGETLSACYLDAQGLAYDPEASWNGDSGQFAIFEVPTGFPTLTVDILTINEETGKPEDEPLTSQSVTIYAPEGGVASMMPFYVNFPGF
ncbi:MAG: hypothetical protein IPI35_31350 [Deltaproteobacteria bacterium]|nr:hypothetical protein [Deltaproteobacteria bacterium]